jgi:uncharacterized protein (DUF58 family)
MERLGYRLYRLMSALRYRVPRRFTPAGMLALSALVVSAAIGVDMDQTVAFQAFSFVACLLLLAMGAALFFRGKFSVHRTLPRFGSVGQPFSYHVRVRNGTNRPQRGLEVLENLADPRPSLDEFVRFQRARIGRRHFRVHLSASPSINQRVADILPPRGESEARVELLPLRRGPLRFTGVTVARTDPFGLFRGFLRVSRRETVLILPKRYPLPDITLPGTRNYQRGGVALAAAVGESEEFVSLRDYRPGDPRRHVHWRSWARLGRPIVKEFQDEFFVRHALILDTFAGPDRTAAFEEAVSVAASFACTVGTQESLLDLLFVGPQAVCFTTGRGLGQAEQALEILAAVRQCEEKPFRDLQELVLRHAGAVCGCVCVLLDWDEPRRELVRQLQARGLPVLVLVVVGPDRTGAIRAARADGGSDQLHILETGHIAEGLQRAGFS